MLFDPPTKRLYVIGGERSSEKPGEQSRQLFDRM